MKTSEASLNLATNVERIRNKYAASGRAKLARGEKLTLSERVYLRQLGEL